MSEKPAVFARQSGSSMMPDPYESAFYLYVGDVLLTVMGPTSKWVQMQAAEINAAVDAEVERRLGEITKGVG